MHSAIHLNSQVTVPYFRGKRERAQRKERVIVRQVQMKEEKGIKKAQVKVEASLPPADKK